MNGTPMKRFEYEGLDNVKYPAEFGSIFIDKAPILFFFNNQECAEDTGMKCYSVTRNAAGTDIVFDDVRLPPLENAGWPFLSSTLLRGMCRYPYNLFEKEAFEQFKMGKDDSANPLLPNFVLYFAIFNNGGEIGLLQCHFVNRQLPKIDPHLPLSIRKKTSLLPNTLPSAPQPSAQPVPVQVPPAVAVVPPPTPAQLQVASAVGGIRQEPSDPFALTMRFDCRGQARPLFGSARNAKKLMESASTIHLMGILLQCT